MQTPNEGDDFVHTSWPSVSRGISKATSKARGAVEIVGSLTHLDPRDREDAYNLAKRKAADRKYAQEVKDIEKKRKEVQKGLKDHAEYIEAKSRKLHGAILIKVPPKPKSLDSVAKKFNLFGKKKP